MSQARLLFRNTAVLAVARIIERSTGLVLALIISRHLGASGLGVYATVTAYFGLIALAGESGSTNLLIRELSKDRARTPSYVSHTSIMALTLSGLVMAVAWLVIPHLGYSPDLTHGLELIVLAVAPGTLNTIQEAVFIAHQRVEFETITTFFGSIVLVISSFLLIHTGHGVVSLIAVFVAVEYAVTIVYFVIISRFITRLRFVFQRATATEILVQMRTFAGSSLVAGLFARPEIVVLSLLGTEAQVGYYSGAIKIVDLFQFVPQVFMTNMFPLLSRSFHLRDGRAQKLQDQALRYLLAFGLPVTVGLACAAQRIIEAFYGENFDSATPLLRILSVSVVLYCVNAVLWRVLASRGEQGLVLQVQVMTAGARLGLGGVLIAVAKATGAAIAAPVALLLHAGLLVRNVRKDGTSVNVLPVWRFAFATAIMGGAVLGFDRILRLWEMVPLAGCVYLAALGALRAFSTDELAYLKRLVAPMLARVSGQS